MSGQAGGRACFAGGGQATSRGARGERAGSSRTHVIQNGRRGDVAHDRPGAHDGCGVRKLPPIMLAARRNPLSSGAGGSGGGGTTVKGGGTGECAEAVTATIPCRSPRAIDRRPRARSAGR
ncbi:hypothetical protein Ctob_016195 [Chrysochromulina tobinii]|uniref:Uncharacterized protein n=1 Tax=Chrysochromulina tobinii TaxID=1460289 RepID=A0A0M0KAN3_9EUKA|nr:hypothetical protein Ctob_016195 [Chrysochromulina tobinii]|eukprot:KOO35448.1 hypothetical protein Ctob_016195 [Chrysochromulina sp. CCMP291]